MKRSPIPFFLLIALAACAPAATDLPASTVTPTVRTYSPAETQSPPGETGYLPPTIEDVTFLAGSDRVIDRQMIIDLLGVDDKTLRTYEDAAVELASASGFSDADTAYVQRGDKWNIYLRDKATNHILWSFRKSDGAMAYQPVMWVIDEHNLPHPDERYELRPLEGSQDATIIYTDEGFLVELDEPVTLPDGSVVFTKWRSVLTGELTDVPGAAEFAQQEILASLPDSYVGLAPTFDQLPDVGSMENLKRLAAWVFANESAVSGPYAHTFGSGEHDDVSNVYISCNYSGYTNCAFLRSVRIGDRPYVLTQVLTKEGPRGLILYFGTVDNGRDPDSYNAIVNLLLLDTDGFSISITTKFKDHRYENEYLYTLAVDPEDARLLGLGEITDSMQLTPVHTNIRP
jgi:hypothetical protein